MIVSNNYYFTITINLQDLRAKKYIKFEKGVFFADL